MENGLCVLPPQVDRGVSGDTAERQGKSAPKWERCQKENMRC